MPTVSFKRLSPNFETTLELIIDTVNEVSWVFAYS